MDFDTFLNIVPKILKQNLLGELAHQFMAPLDIKIRMANFDEDLSRKAAVLVLVYPKDNKSHLALILRTSYNGVHSSQVAFPGGKAELSDPNYEFTALRETFEEVGISSDQITVLRPLSEIYVQPSNFLVYPFLGVASSELVFDIDPLEVAGMIAFPISDLLDDSIISSNEISTNSSQTITVPCFQIDNKPVWGATAMILSELKEILKISLKTASFCMFVI